MSSSVVMVKLWQALQVGVCSKDIALSESAFSMLSQFRKNRFKRVLSKEYASVCSESYQGTEDAAKPSKNLFVDNLSENNLKFLERISYLSKLQNLHLITTNLAAVKVFNLFAKAPGFSHNQFLRKPNTGAISHQGESFSDQSQKEEVQIQKRNLPFNRENQILSQKLVQINFRQDCFTNDKGTSNSFPILTKTTEKNPSNSPSFEERIQNIKSGNSILKRSRCYHRNFFNSSKVFKPTLYSPKMLRGEMTCDKPCSSKQPHLQSTIQDGRFRKSRILTKNPGDYFMKIDLSDAYLSISVHEDSQPYLAFIFDQVTYAFKTMPSGLNVAPARFTKVFKPVLADLRAQSIQALIWLEDILVISSSYSSCIRDRDIVMDLLVNLGFLLNMEKSVLIPTQNGDRFINHEIFFFGREGFSNCSKGNTFKEQESGIGEGTLPVDRSVLGYSPCSKGSFNPL